MTARRLRPWGWLLLVLLVAPPAYGAVAFDAKMTTGNSADGLNQECNDAATTCTSTGITVGASASCLVATVVWKPAGVTAPASRALTWNAVATTEAAFVTSTDGAGTVVSVGVYVLVSPASGAQTLTVTWASNQADVYMSAVSFTGTDTSTCINATNSTTATQTTSLTIASTASAATVAVLGVDGDAPAVGGSGVGCGTFTKIFSEAPLDPGGAASYQTSSGVSCTHTLTPTTGTRQALAGVNVIPAAGASNTAGPLVNSPMLKGLVGGGLLQ